MELLARIKEQIIDPAVLVLFTAGLLLFMVGLVQYMNTLRQGGNPKEGVQHMIWGMVGMLIMVSVTGIIALISGTIGVDPMNPADINRANLMQPADQKFFPGFLP